MRTNRVTPRECTQMFVTCAPTSMTASSPVLLEVHAGVGGAHGANERERDQVEADRLELRALGGGDDGVDHDRAARRRA